MGVADILTVLFVILCVAGVAVAAMRWSSRARTEEHARIRAFNALLVQVAESHSLSYDAQPDYVHPTLGPIPMYAVLSGEIDGLKLNLSVNRSGIASSNNFRDHIEVALEAGDEGAWPAKRALNEGQALRALNELASAVEVGPGRLIARPRCSPAGSEQFVQQRLFKSEEELLTFLKIAVQTCAELRGRAQPEAPPPQPQQPG